MVYQPRYTRQLHRRIDLLQGSADGARQFPGAVHKHSARQIVESLDVWTLASLLWGDFSGVAASVPVVLGMLHHSRDAEREADELAIRLLQAQGVSVEPLVEFFERIMDLESQIGADKIPGFLRSHPATDERLERLRREIR